MKIIKSMPLGKVQFPSIKEYSPAVQGITQSMLSGIGCPMKMALSLNRLRNPESEYKFIFGDMSHYVTEALYTRYEKTKKKPGSKFIANQFNKYIKENRKRWKTIGQEIIDLHLVKGNALLNCYVDFWSTDFKKVKYVEIERTFGVKYPFGLKGVMLRGKRDLIRKIKGKLWIMDHKFYSQINPDLLDRLLMDFQTKFYYLAFELEFGKYPEGIVYNVIRKPGIKPKNEEKLDDYQERLADEIRAKETHYFQRYEIRITDDVMEEFKVGLDAKIKILYRYISGKIPLHKNEFQCFGKYTCDHLETCNANRISNYYKGDKQFPELNL